MAKKRIKKSRKKSYLKRNSRRTIRRKDRRISRRKDKRKNKKTRKKKQRGGSRKGTVQKHLLEKPDIVSEGTGKVEVEVDGKWVSEPAPLGVPLTQQELLRSGNLFGPQKGESKSINVPYILYNGHPTAISHKIVKYKKEISDAKDGGGFNDSVNLEILSRIFPEGYPRYILISGHGSMIDCFYGQPCFTILPRGYKLILATETGVSLRISNIKEKQVDATYYRLYEGLIPNQKINFNLILKNADGEIQKKIITGGPSSRPHGQPDRGDERSDGTTESWKGRLRDGTYDPNLARSGTPGVILTGVREGVPKGAHSEADVISGELDYYLNLGPGLTQPSIPMELANKIKNSISSIEEIDEYADLFLEHLTPLPESPESPIIDCYAEYSVIPKEKTKEQIVNKVSQHIPETRGFEYFRLSQLLKHIEKVGETNENIPKVILGGFCRSGEFNFNIDGLIKESGERLGLPALTAEYFSGDINYEGVSSELRRGISLASKTKPQDFWNIIDNLKINLEYFDPKIEASLDPDSWAATDDIHTSFIENKTIIVSKFRDLIEKIENVSDTMENDIYTGINLSFFDVSLIFQMDNCLKLHPLGFPLTRSRHITTHEKAKGSPELDKDLMDSTRLSARMQEDAASVDLAIRLVDEEQAHATARQTVEAKLLRQLAGARRQLEECTDPARRELLRKNIAVMERRLAVADTKAQEAAEASEPEPQPEKYIPFHVQAAVADTKAAEALEPEQVD